MTTGSLAVVAADAKGVQAGSSEHVLSPEEQQAIAHAGRVRA